MWFFRFHPGQLSFLFSTSWKSHGSPSGPRIFLDSCGGGCGGAIGNQDEVPEDSTNSTLQALRGSAHLECTRRTNATTMVRLCFKDLFSQCMGLNVNGTEANCRRTRRSCSQSSRLESHAVGLPPFAESENMEISKTGSEQGPLFWHLASPR